MIRLGSKIVKELVSIVSNRVVARCDDIKIGSVYVGVKLSNGYGGVAYRMHKHEAHSLEIENSIKGMDLLKQLIGKSLSELAKLAEDDDYLLSSIGIATINAASQSLIFNGSRKEYDIIMDIDCLDALDIYPVDRVVMVGALPSYVYKLRNYVERLTVYDDNKQALAELGLKEPDEKIKDALGNATVVIITGSSLVNKTIDELLEASSNARVIAVVGPTASIVPDPLFKRGVKALGGVYVYNVDEMLKIVGEGGGARLLLSNCARKYTLLRRDAPVK